MSNSLRFYDVQEEIFDGNTKGHSF